MSADATAEQVLRRFEATLDAHHRSLPLWSRPREEAIFATLAAFDLMMLPLFLGLMGAGPRPQAVQKIKWLHDSLIHVMQFFWQESRELEVRPRAQQSLIEQGFALLSHCEYLLRSVNYEGEITPADKATILGQPQEHWTLWLQK